MTSPMFSSQFRVSDGNKLKNISQIEHHRHRSGVNFMVNAVAALIAYTHQDKKPSIDLSNLDIEAEGTLMLI